MIRCHIPTLAAPAQPIKRHMASCKPNLFRSSIADRTPMTERVGGGACVGRCHGRAFGHASGMVFSHPREFARRRHHPVVPNNLDRRCQLIRQFTALPTGKRRLRVASDWALAGSHPDDVALDLPAGQAALITHAENVAG